MDFDLPYFDTFAQEFGKGKNNVLETLIGRNVHWGYWENPDEAILSPEEFQKASDRLTQKLLDRAEPEAGQKILDVGCGYGGTVALLNETKSNLKMTGLNIDARQIERAKALVQTKVQNGNSIDFVVGNACKLPFADASFDTVLAVECIFHFPSREDFFREASRVLRPGGRLVLSDFVAELWLLPLIGAFLLWYKKDVGKVYGNRNTLSWISQYRSLARKAGLKITAIDDITKNTLPTYPTMKKYAAHSGFEPEVFKRAHVPPEFGARTGAVKYDVIALEKRQIST